MNEPTTPTEIVRHVCQLIDQERWSEVGQWLDPLALANWRDGHLSMLRSVRAAPSPATADHYREHNPDMPVEVAQWMADQAAGSGAGMLANSIGGSGTMEELSALSPAELFGRMLEARDPRTLARKQMPYVRPELADVIGEIPFQHHEVMGEVIARDTAYVTFLTKFELADAGGAAVVVLRRSHDRWRVLPGSPLFQENSTFSVGVDQSGQKRRPLSVRQVPWVERHFSHELTPEHFPALLERFRGTPARVETLGWMPASLRTARQNGRWSIQEHIGHLLDLETLSEKRLDDFRRRAPTLAAADMTNRATHEAGHNRAVWWALIQAFTDARGKLVAGLEALPADVIAHKAVHPRLERPMNVPEWVFFMCEHDDHHLAVVRAISDQWQADFLEGSATVDP